jgi:hypothetical protein
MNKPETKPKNKTKHVEYSNCRAWAYAIPGCDGVWNVPTCWLKFIQVSAPIENKCRIYGNLHYSQFAVHKKIEFFLLFFLVCFLK